MMQEMGLPEIVYNCIRLQPSNCGGKSIGSVPQFHCVANGGIKSARGTNSGDAAIDTVQADEDVQFEVGLLGSANQLAIRCIASTASDAIHALKPHIASKALNAARGFCEPEVRVYIGNHQGTLGLSWNPFPGISNSVGHGDTCTWCGTWHPLSLEQSSHYDEGMNYDPALKSYEDLGYPPITEFVDAGTHRHASHVSRIAADSSSSQPSSSACLTRSAAPAEAPAPGKPVEARVVGSAAPWKRLPTLRMAQDYDWHTERLRQSFM